MATVKKKKKHSAMKLSLLVGLLAIVSHFCIEIVAFQTGPLSPEGFISGLELKFLDMKFVSRSKRFEEQRERLPEPKAVIVAVDEKSIERYGLWPWSRSVMADITRALTKAGAKDIAFDIVFSEPDRNSAYQTIRNFESEYSQGIDKGRVTISTISAGLAEAEEQVEELLKSYDKLQKNSEQNLKALKKQGKSGKEKEVKLAKENAKKAEALNKELLKNIKLLRARQDQLAELKEQSAILQGKMDNYKQRLTNQVASASPDVAFAKAISEATNLVLGYFIFQDVAEMEGIDDDERAQDLNRIKSSEIDKLYDISFVEMGGKQLVATKEVKGNDKIKNLYLPSNNDFVGAQAPMDLFAEVTPYKGHFNAIPDFDGPLRRAMLLRRIGNTLYPSMTLLAASLYLGANIMPVVDEANDSRLNSIYLGDYEKQIPLNERSEMLINYYINPQSYFTKLSAVDVVDGLVDDQIKGKMAFIGTTATGTMDQRVTPFSSFTPGVYVNAMAAQNIVDGQYLLRPVGWAMVEYLCIVFLAVFLGFLLKRVPVSVGGPVTLVIMTAIVLVDMYGVFGNGYWSHIVMPLLQCLLTYIVITVYRFLTEVREKNQIRNAFQFYLSRSVVDEVLKDTSKLTLSGERRELTVLFSDIRGFTTISEGLSPEGLANLLNEYLSPMTDLVFKYDGTLDKYMGDAIMAFFGAPVSYKDHALRGCQVALAMMDKLHELQKGWAAKGMPIINIGIGLNTGDMAVGNMGSNIRFDYTVMGDNVNLGSRLEGINKQYKTNIVISEFTFRAAGDGIYARELDAVRVKGKKEPVTIYELRGLGQPPEEEGRWIKSFEEGLAMYKAQKWDEAIARFAELKQERENDYPCQLYIDRCEHMKLNPPGDDWDGVCTMTTK